MTVTVQLTIHSDNDAFQDCPSFETARIIREVAERVECSPGECHGNLRDVNGNTVGSFYFTDKN